MDLLAISAAGMALRETAHLVREFRQSKAAKREFESALAKALETNATSTAKTGKAEKQRLDRQSAEFMRKRDVDGNGLLSRAESGLEQATFDRLDANTDGQLSKDELAAYFKAQS